MDAVFKISAAALTGTLLALILKKQAPEHAMLAVLGCGIVLLFSILELAGDLADAWNRLAAHIPHAGEIAGPLWKATGIAIVTHLSAQLCRDCGQSALGAKVELVGTAACIAVFLPLAEMTFDLIEAML